MFFGIIMSINSYIFVMLRELPGVYDFETGNRNLGDFLLTAQRLNLWVFIRPGPYVCAEWDAGGHP
jgi:beta-galactosidase